MLCSRQPPFVSFLHVGISVLFQVTHLALWGTDLLLVRQAPEDDKVHLQLKDMGMGWRWAWWMHIECSWLSRPHCDIQPPRTSQFPSQISEGELSHIPLQGKARQKKKCTSCHPSLKTVSREQFKGRYHSLHQILCPPLLFLLRFACFWWPYRNSPEFALWACTEKFFFFNLALYTALRTCLSNEFCFFPEKEQKRLYSCDFWVKYDLASPPSGYFWELQATLRCKGILGLQCGKSIEIWNIYFFFLTPNNMSHPTMPSKFNYI